MSYGNNVTIVGNVTRDPEVRISASGVSVATFGVAWNQKRQNGDEVTSFFDVTCFYGLADNVATSVQKGHRVVVTGGLNQSSWTTEEGDKRHKVKIIADEVGPSLRFATADVVRNTRDDGEGSTQGRNDGGKALRPEDLDEEPF